MTTKVNPFTFVDAVSYSKQDLLSDPELEKEYIPFIVNKALSYHVDALVQANDMNLYYDIDKKLQFDYFRRSLKARKRFAKWVKKPDSSRVKQIQQYYSCNERDAEEMSVLLTQADIDAIEQFLAPGGR